MTWYLLLLAAVPAVLRFLKWITLLVFAAYVLGKTGESNSLRDVAVMLKAMRAQGFWRRSADGDDVPHQIPPNTS